MSSNLQTYITGLLNIPVVKENQTIMDGSFIIEPYIVESLKGNGEVKNVSIISTVNLFYKRRNDAVEKGIYLFQELCKQNNYCCENPDFTYETEAKFWRTSMRVQEVINNGNDTY